MFSKPVIVGLPMQRRSADAPPSVSADYADVLASLGVTPLILPLLEEEAVASAVAPLLELCQGFLLTGSVADVHPSRYGAGDIPEGGYCDTRRDALDYVVMDHAAKTNKPVFGICRGCQVMNVYRGGTLAWRYQQILPDTPITHMHDHDRRGIAHRIAWEKGAWLASQMPEAEQGVNSLHNQVCLRVAPSLRVAAMSEDGLVEAIEDVQHPDRFFAVQWHPELRAAGGDVSANAIFDRFVRACRGERFVGAAAAEPQA